MQSLQIFLMAGFQCFLADNKINRRFDDRTLFVIVPGNVVCLLIMPDDLFGLLAEDIDVLVSDKLMDFHVCTVGCTERYGAV